MGQFDKIQLAQEAFPIVAVATARLASETVNCRLGELSAYLCSFAEETLHFSGLQKLSLERDGRIEKVLRALEGAISWDRVAKPSHYACLRVVAEAQRSADEDTSAGTASVTAVESRIRNTLAKRRPDCKTIVSLLRACSEIRIQDSMEDPGAVSAYEDLQGYPKHLRMLEEVLASYAECTCTKQDPSDRHWTRVRLKPAHELSDDRFLPFEMLLSAFPNPSRTPVCEWQAVQVLVPTKAAPRRVQFAQERPLSNWQKRKNSGHDSDAVEGNICAFVSSRCGSTICFKIRDGQLRVLRETEIPKQGIRPELGLPLGSILEKFKMRHGTRPVLAFTLAKAVWHCYDSEWMNIGLINNSVYFMEEVGDGQEGAYFCKPYLSAELRHPQSEKLPECRQIFGMMHKYPRLLALGIMLLEIATSTPIPTQGHPSQWTPATANEQWTRLKSFVTTGKFQDDCQFPKYKRAVEKCLDPKLFKNAPFNPSKAEENLEERRQILYDEVVEPLRQLIEGTGWDSEFDEIEKTPLAPKTTAAPKSVDPEVKSPKLADKPEPGLDSRWQRDHWLEEMVLVSQKIRAESKAKPMGVGSVKIAILDTGYDEDSPSFDLPGHARRIKRWQDFVESSPTPKDAHGHGTHLVTLLLQIAPSVELYVARVAKDVHGLKTAEDSISKAIRVAAFEWDVDFVSMSFGFVRHVEKIREAIYDAVHHKRRAITFFAAAANDGFNSREMFPANLGDSVIAIRGTNRAGAFEPDFNPPLSSGEPVFGTLGKDVVSDWIGTELRRSLSGCSVATPIAVGIASIILDYAMARSGEFYSDELRLMRTRRGIYEIFKEIGVHAGEGRHYIAPFDLFRMREDVRLAKLKAAIGRHPEHW